MVHWGKMTWSIPVWLQLWKAGHFSPHSLSPASGWVILMRLTEIHFKDMFLHSISPSPIYKHMILNN